ncbi:unnamed protein product [Dibothriocephalus latus]|uniref:Thioredoxin domain-containing protein n=1 Tax=Dibothriocephalus latus TaxID=60516 RepID=A0A3P7LUR6_DIBLA|nr:unnamed protein product [Dibothriocephalus latus]
MANLRAVKLIKPHHLPAVLEKYTYVIVNFFASWLAASYEVTPIIEKLAQKYPKIKFVTVDVSKNQDPLKAFNCPGLPYVIIFWKGLVLDRCDGATGNSVKNMVKTVTKEGHYLTFSTNSGKSVTFSDSLVQEQKLRKEIV